MGVCCCCCCRCRCCGCVACERGAPCDASSLLRALSWQKSRSSRTEEPSSGLGFAGVHHLLAFTRCDGAVIARLLLCSTRRWADSRIDSRMENRTVAGPPPRPTATDRSCGVATGAVTGLSCHGRRRSTRSASAASCRCSCHLPGHAVFLFRRPRTPPRCPPSIPAAVVHSH